MDQTFYVYAHYDGDEVVYVGKGQGGRILATTRLHNKNHLRFINDNLSHGDLTFAKFLITQLTEAEALEEERKLIQHYQPRYNKRFTEKQREKARQIAMTASYASMKKIHTPAGVFESISEASRHYGVTPGAIWHRIKDKPTEYYYVKEQHG